MSKFSRRNLIKTLAGGVAVLGFDPVRRAWATTASGGLEQVPPLDGVLVTDDASLAAAADDFGHIKHRRPVAVLKPGSVDDVATMVRFARAQRLKIAARGRGHTPFGQAQAEAGIVVDMSTLNQIHEIGADFARVDAGVVWRDLIVAAAAKGVTPPVLTDFIGLSIAGTLSVGGISGSSHHYGAQVDNVLELTVVTGEGEVVRCSPSENRDLFDVALAGLGQCGLIVSATLRLVPAKERARVFRLFYPDTTSMLRDERILIADGRFSHVLGFMVPVPDGTFAKFIEAVSFYTPPDSPSEAALTSGLSPVPGATQIEDHTYVEFCLRIDALITAVTDAGLFGFPHPWMDMFVPGSKAEAFIDEVLQTFTPADLGASFPILFYPLLRRKLAQPLLRVPDDEVVFLFDILRAATPGATPADEMVADNRALFERNRELGGKHYVISAVDLSQDDWRQHFQPYWGMLVSAKRKFDPDGVLGPGPGIFS